MPDLCLLPLPLRDPFLTRDPNVQQKTNVGLLSLPNELLNVIALHLQASDLIRSIANLGLCSKRLRNVTVALVWREVRWKDETWMNVFRRSKQNRPYGWKYVE